MYTLLKPIQVRQTLLSQNYRIFTALDFMRLFNINPQSTKYFLETQTKQGFLTRLRQGLYTLQTDPPSDEETANAMYKPSYISFEYALSYYHLIPEMPYTITSATTKSTRLFTNNLGVFSYRTIKKSAYTGYYLYSKNGIRFLIAEPEKTAADYLYFVSLNKLPHNDRLFLAFKQKLNKRRLYNYIAIFNSKRLQKLLKTYIP